jgi:C4-dicarboxylate transporter DctM subunit
VPLVIYAILTEQNIAKLFMAAVIPGIIAMLGYMVVIGIIARVDPDAGRASVSRPTGREAAGDRATWPVMLIFVAVIGGIYGGIFTPTEAAASGHLATGIVAWRLRADFPSAASSNASTAPRRPPR